MGENWSIFCFITYFYHCVLFFYQMEEELHKFASERANSQRKLHESQAKEIEHFDEETRGLGIDPVEIYTADDDFKKILDDGENRSVSGMSVSNSSASFNTQL